MDIRGRNLFAENGFEEKAAPGLSCVVAGKSEAVEFRKLLAGEPPELGPGPRAGVLPQDALKGALEPLLADVRFSAESRGLIRGLVLLWHDQLEPAHVIAQGIENADGSFLHGIIHRREPDYGNAKYWFRRVGRHACFPAIAQKAAQLLERKNEHSPKSQLIPGGEWEPFAFIDLCEEVNGRTGKKALAEAFREIQAIEFEVLLEYFLSKGDAAGQ